MIKIWKQSEKGVKESAILEKACWMQVTDPTPLEIESLEQEYGIDPDGIADVLDVDERSRLEHGDGYLLMIIRVPMVASETDIPYFTIPFGVVLSKDIVITISKEEPAFIKEFIERRRNGFDLSNTRSFILKLLQHVATHYLRSLKDINRRTNEIEHDLRRSIKNTELVRLLNMEKSLVFFTTSLKSNELLIDKLAKTQFKDLAEAEQDMMDDLITDNRQAIEMSNIYSNILSGMMDAFASVISNNLNAVMKRLTMISIVLMIPTLFASLYGMNIGLPFQHSPFAFAGVVGVSVITALVGSLFFLSKKTVK